MALQTMQRIQRGKQPVTIPEDLAKSYAEALANTPEDESVFDDELSFETNPRGTLWGNRMIEAIVKLDPEKWANKDGKPKITKSVMPIQGTSPEKYRVAFSHWDRH